MKDIKTKLENNRNNIQKIVTYITDGTNDAHRLGLELEHLIYNEEYRVIPYKQMASCLVQFAEKVGGKPYILDGKLLGVEADGYALSLEPGCQLEISIEPLGDVNEIRRIYDAFREVADPIFDACGYRLHEGAVLPFIASGEQSVDDIELLPKERYRVMDAHFRKSGTCGAYMMRASASTQVSVDFSSEEDALRKVRILEKLAPLMMLLTENRDGLPYDRRWQPHLIRSQIWRDVDPVRCGYLQDSLSENYSFADYAGYIYHSDSILIREHGVLHPTEGKSAAEWYSDRPIEDVDYLLSMYFPHVRIKKYIEYRIADSMPIGDAIDYASMIRAIVYNEDVLCAVEQMFAEVHTVQELERAETAVTSDGYRASIYGRPVLEWLDELFDRIRKGIHDPEELERIRRMRPLPLLEYQYHQIIRGKEDLHAPEDRAIKEYLNQSTAKYHNRVVGTLYVPKLFTHRQTRQFDRLIRELYGIFDKVIAHYIADADYRALFGFPKELEELILQQPLYTRNIPMSRIDLFLDEQTGAFKFCEFNTDGASAMNEDRELNLAFAQSLAYKEYAKDHDCHTYELFDSWVDEALQIYREYAHDERALPRVAIVDFLENATINEFYIFKEAFERQGCAVTVCDMRELRFDGKRCYTDEFGTIDLVYRRAVTSDILSHMEESQEFLRAFRSGALCVLGDFRTQIVHNKILYKILHMEQTMSFLSASERAFVRAHIPLTMSLNELFDGKHEELREEVLNHKDGWIIKPEDSYGSKGVHAGVELETEEQWQQAVHEAKDLPYVLQEFCTPYRLDNIVFRPEGWRWTDTSNLTGLFVYNGQFHGIYSRISYEQVISTQYNEMSLPTMIVD